MERGIGLFIFFVFGLFGQVAFFSEFWKEQFPFWLGFGLQLFPFVAAYFGMLLLEESESSRLARWGGRFAEWGVGSYLFIAVAALLLGFEGLLRPTGWRFFLLLVAAGLLPGVLYALQLRGWRERLLERDRSLSLAQSAASPFLLESVEEEETEEEDGLEKLLFVEDLEMRVEGSALKELFEYSETESDWVLTPEPIELTWKERLVRIGWDPLLLGLIFVGFLGLTGWIHVWRQWQDRPLMLWASYGMWGGGLLLYIIQAVERASLPYLAPSPLHARTRRVICTFFHLVLGLVGVAMLIIVRQDMTSTFEDVWVMILVGLAYSFMMLVAFLEMWKTPMTTYHIVEDGLLEQHPEGTLLWPWERLAGSSWEPWNPREYGYLLHIGISHVGLRHAGEESEFSAALRELLASLPCELASKGEDEKKQKKRILDRAHRRYLKQARSLGEDGTVWMLSDFVVIRGEEAMPSLSALAESLAHGKSHPTASQEVM